MFPYPKSRTGYSGYSTRSRGHAVIPAARRIQAPRVYRPMTRFMNYGMYDRPAYRAYNAPFGRAARIIQKASWNRRATLKYNAVRSNPMGAVQQYRARANSRAAMAKPKAVVVRKATKKPSPWAGFRKKSQESGSK